MINDGETENEVSGSRLVPLREHLSDRFWLASTAVVVLVTALVPLVFNRLHYFVDDSVNGAFGQWFHLGSSLREGRLPLLEPSVWSSGNLFAEGQWGFFNPLILLVSVFASLAQDAAVFTTVVKIGAILVGACGVYALTREFGARPVYAFGAGILAPFTGFTTFFDAPSWVTGLFAWSLLPWAWAYVSRLCRGVSGPIPAFIFGYLLISIGYVHGTIALALVIGLTLSIRAVWRDWRAVRNLLLIGVALGLVAVAVHITSLLTAPVTNRGGSAVYMDQFMTLDLSGMAMSPVATALPQAAAWWWVGLTAPVPIAYLAWVLPLAAVIRWTHLLRVNRRLVDVLVGLGVFSAFIMLPTVIGPLRYPTRMLPYLALCGIVLIAVGLDRALKVTAPRVAVVFAVLAVSAFLSWAQGPQYIRRIAVAVFLVSAGTALVLRILGSWQRGRTRTISLGVAWSLIGLSVFTLQQAVYPRSIWPDQEIPTQISQLQTQLKESVNDTIVVGDPLALPASDALWSETLFANSWYVNPNSVLNRYQLLGFNGFNSALCLGYLGETCPDLAASLFEVREATGLALVDQLSVDSVQIIKTEQTSVYLDDPPAGWHVATDGEFTQLWVRDEPRGSAGGIVATTEGVEIADVIQSPEGVSFAVTEAPDGGGKVVFSRLAWPGYAVDGASIGDPADGFLLTVDVTADSIVNVAFRPAGIQFALVSLSAAILIVGSWAASGAVSRRRAAHLPTPRGQHSA
ncbi:hypothetical protein V6S02_03000 [Microbacterium sp. CCNWLW134]|uniref:hypothetical protein n=1 Tax=Microbacterium sp. CCNWLW134 TaxID=3122064 RepID=UPI00300F8B2B